MDIVRFMHAKARGAEFNLLRSASLGDAPVGMWCRFDTNKSSWSPRDFADELKQGTLRIDPAHADKEYGPLSLALLMDLKYGPVPDKKQSPELKAALRLFHATLSQHNKGKQLTRGYVSPLMLTEDKYLQHGMFAEYLADQGL